MLVLPNSYLLFCIPLRVPLLSTAKDEEETNKNHIHVSGDGQKTRNVSEYDDGLKHCRYRSSNQFGQCEGVLARAAVSYFDKGVTNCIFIQYFWPCYQSFPETMELLFKLLLLQPADMLLFREF